MDPRLLYSFDPEVWATLHGASPVLLHLLDGYVDAGSVTHSLARYLLDHCEHEVLAEFDHDQLHDYRSRRPTMVFDTNRWVGVTDFSLTLRVLTDAAGQEFLLFSGPEPDTQWIRTARAVLGLAERLNVSRLVTAAGIPMAVPHSRPTLVTTHATDPDLAPGNPAWIDRIQVPGSFSAMLEFRSGQQGLTGIGFVAHVPHYLAQSSFPQASLAVLGRIMDATGLVIDTSDLTEAAQARIASIAAEVAQDGDFPALLSSLEQQYDEMAESGMASVPTADEIGAVVEQFLAEHEPDETQD